MKKQFDDILWEIGSGIENIKLMCEKQDDDSDEICFVSKSELRTFLSQRILGFEKTSVQFLEFAPDLYLPILSPTPLGFFKAIQKGLDQVVDSADFHMREIVYKRVAGFFSREMRLEFITRFENNELQWHEILHECILQVVYNAKTIFGRLALIVKNKNQKREKRK